jgi:uncharacterized protein YqgC (DUF456 family)
MKTVSHAYESYAQARAAVVAIEKAGIPSSDVSIVANRHVTPEYADDGAVSDAAAGAGIGGVVGGGAGLLAGIGLMAIPGLGPVVAAGWLAATAVGAAAGVATGSLMGALIGSGVEEEVAAVHAEAVRRGGTLVTARVPDTEVARIEGLMAIHRPVDPAERAAAWREEGWTTFDPQAPAYRPSETEIQRMRREWRDEGMGKQA